MRSAVLVRLQEIIFSQICSSKLNQTFGILVIVFKLQC